MPRIRTYLFFLVILTVSGIAALTAGDPGSRSAEPPLMQEVRTIMTQEAAELKSLQADLENAPSEREALAILRRIAERKRATEIAVLRIQERRAREEGDTAAARRIDQAVQRILDPRPVAPSPEAVREMEARRAAERGRD